MSCEYCHGTGWLLTKKDAPSPPYEEGQQLEYGTRCVCQHESKRPYQDQQTYEN
jgi:hypothetical protein